MKVKHENKYVMGFCLMPSYILTPFLLSWFNPVVWVFGTIVMLYITSWLYRYFILSCWSIDTKMLWVRYVNLFLFQMLVLLSPLIFSHIFF